MIQCIYGTKGRSFQGEILDNDGHLVKVETFPNGSIIQMLMSFLASSRLSCAAFHLKEFIVYHKKTYLIYPQFHMLTILVTMIQGRSRDRRDSRSRAYPSCHDRFHVLFCFQQDNFLHVTQYKRVSR